MYFMSGTICSICVFLVLYFTDPQFIIPFKASPSLSPKSFWWFWLIIFIFVNYTLGLLVSTLSSIFIEKLLITCLMTQLMVLLNKWRLLRRCKYLKSRIKYFRIRDIIPKNTYNVFTQLFEKEFNFTFDKNYIRLITSIVESKAVNSYSTAFVFLTIYGTCRNICFVFFSTAIAVIVMNINQLQYTHFLFGLIMILFFLISLQGYIRFYEYHISHIISAYININKRLLNTKRCRIIRGKNCIPCRKNCCIP